MDDSYDTAVVGNCELFADLLMSSLIHHSLGLHAFPRDLRRPRPQW